MIGQACMKILAGITTGALILVLAGCGSDPGPGTEAASEAAPPGQNRTMKEVRELDWEDLVPVGYRPEDFFENLGLDSEEVLLLDDDDPRTEELLLKFKAFLEQAPVVPELDGFLVRLPGFVVPLEGDGEMIFEFLLVPYFGACIHEPPPPANQVVHVIIEKGKGMVIKGLLEAVYVTGILRVRHSSSELAEAGYALYPTDISVYQ
jgi:uncharacterized protein